MARFIHQNSPRQSSPFQELNCAAIPASLIESELFGYVKGAFTGAVTDRSGKFAQADGGTLFLDEIGEMPLEVQAKVLRAIENQQFEPLGSDRLKRVDARIICATNRDLEALIKRGQFREDLYYRLNVVNIEIPPLREHLEDLPELATMFLENFCRDVGKPAMRFAPDALEFLKTHDWPENVRELRNIVQRCVVKAEASEIGPELIAKAIRKVRKRD
jgi:transcriptional regulator with GAF, ATPase, and Fis domain